MTLKLASSRQKRLRNRLIVGILILVCIVGAAGLEAYLTWHQRMVGRQAAQQYGQALTSLCRSPSSTRAEVGFESTPKLLVLNENGEELHDLHNELPLEWRAERSDEVDLVVCITLHKYRIEKCYYGGPDIERYQQDYRVVVIDATTGHVAATGTIEGDTPDPCPVLTSEFKDIEGSKPEATDLIEWLEEELLVP
jgi:hypothetical protein